MIDALSPLLVCACLLAPSVPRIGSSRQDKPAVDEPEPEDVRIGGDASRRYLLHYITAREGYNLAMAAAEGATGDPTAYLDRTIGPYVAGPRRSNPTVESARKLP